MFPPKPPVTGFLLIPDLNSKLLKTGGGIQEMGGNPENGPGFTIVSPQGLDSVLLNKIKLAELGVIGMLRLLTLASGRIYQLSAAPEHQEGQIFQLPVAGMDSQPVDIRGNQDPIDINMFILG